MVLFLAVAISLMIYRAAKTPGGKRAWRIFRQAQRVAIDSATAPGTKELQKLGCESAMVMDVEALSQAFLDGDGGVTKGQVPPVRLLVTCGVGITGKAPTCAQVARTYLRAVTRAKGTFQVTVQQQLRPRPRCVACYDPTGASIPCGTREPHGLGGT